MFYFIAALPCLAPRRVMGTLLDQRCFIALRMVSFSCSAFPVYIATVTYCCTALLSPSAACTVLGKHPTP